jgi:hypothetical protein
MFLSTPIFAQEKDSSATVYKYWMTAGLWCDMQLSLNFNYCFSLGDNFYKAEYMKRGYDFPFGGISSGYGFNLIDVSIGKRLQSEWFQISHFIGPEYIYGIKKTSSGMSENFNTVGIQMETQVLFRLANEVGLGFGLYGNINFEKHFAGVNVNLTLGNGK